ncbi:Ig-like domain repeat protein, partial [Streptomyces meridianus]
SDYTGSSDTEPHTVNAAATTTTVAGSPNPSVVGEDVIATATVVANAPGAGTPTGNVTFDFGDGSPTVTVPLMSGTATTPPHAYTSVSGSPYTITATYTGTSDYTGSSDTDTQDVNPALTDITLVDSPDPSVVGEDVTATATVVAVAPGGGTPTGSVDFDFDDGTPVVNVPLDGTGTATTPVHAYTTAGVYAITATYNGNDDYLVSFDADPHVVNPADTTTTIISDDPDPSAIGEDVTVTATVVAVGPGGGTPTGTVDFDFGDGNTADDVPLDGTGTATAPVHAYGASGTFTITATYDGAADYNISDDTEDHDVV